MKKFVYLLKRGNHYKIGKTDDVNHRVRHISPKIESIVFNIPSDDADNIEGELKTLFHEKQVYGEWYQLSKDDIKEFPKIVQDRDFRQEKIDEVLDIAIAGVSQLRGQDIHDCPQTNIKDFSSNVYKHLPRVAGETLLVTSKTVPFFSITALANSSNSSGVNSSRMTKELTNSLDHKHDQ